MATRREFIKTAALTGALFGAGVERALFAGETRKAQANTARTGTRNIIFMVADGMNIGSLSATRHFQKNLLGQENVWLSLYNTHPIVRSLMETSSANSIVTDSAAASSSWGCGQRINNGQINISARDGSDLEPICTTVRKRGMATGLVTTATVTHATPAGFAANSPKRGDEALIAHQYLERQIDVVLGGGQKFFDEELLANYQQAGYGLVTTREELLSAEAPSSPLLGLFAHGHLPFTIDRNAFATLQQEVPTLAEMTTAALDRLSKAPDGFLLQVEGARVDHAGHANDAASLIHDQIAFDDAIAVVRDFAASHPDTLVIITTDHGTGGMNLNGKGPGYRDTTAAFEKIGKFTRSYGQMKKDAKPLGTDALRQYLVDVTDIKFGGGELQAMALALQAIQAYSPDSMDDAALIQMASLPDIFKTETSIGWTSGNHTGELVELAAFGPGSERISPLVRNEELHGVMLEALGIQPA
ncbi:alkaline phosphatase [Ruficoccus sp. ZRK36]|uniref:alkaline phosphatase n=1 Tax=Ruficoccus sp. ZRK36 TaxID=2866311 RepID=UPI001C72FF50|nr:alkaline phosphatase [Ruficoccus sp. ZRK36]QYY35240.1 alkaline phosphatase [Ruficoccus sp. ZRK36]